MASAATCSAKLVSSGVLRADQPLMEAPVKMAGKLTRRTGGWWAVTLRCLAGTAPWSMETP
jgi:hypothetical protein